MKVTMSQRMDLRSYPLDQHDLVVTYMSAHYSNSNVSLRLIAEEDGEASWTITPWIEGWTITGTTHEVGKKALLDATGESHDYDVVVMTIHVKRDPEYYIMNQALPLAVIMAMASTTFVFELNGFEKRITVLFTSILTLMAFSVYLGENMPRTAYSTGMHILIYMSYTMLLLAVCHTSSLWLILREHLLLADEDGDGETSHEEMVNYLRTKQRLELMTNELHDAGLMSPRNTEGRPPNGRLPPLGEEDLEGLENKVGKELSDPNPVLGLSMMDMDRDGQVSEEERRLWEALDKGKDGSLSLNELLEHTIEIPIAEWTPSHVYTLSLIHI
eukprot:TRINITY_DN20007_c0_g1_i10.p1 TRINITY_DN20007_c0_g1~~TRINITY_DN20007_c0_g1_i10.p1  ORF type:complete len:329 (-),score=96.94 TRINITY_DN20007_c0_g1_i10:118-1104(-)